MQDASSHSCQADQPAAVAPKLAVNQSSGQHLANGGGPIVTEEAAESGYSPGPGVEVTVEAAFDRFSCSSLDNGEEEADDSIQDGGVRAWVIVLASFLNSFICVMYTKEHCLLYI